MKYPATGMINVDGPINIAVTGGAVTGLRNNSASNWRSIMVTADALPREEVIPLDGAMG
jgi:hypothetical protein